MFEEAYRDEYNPAFEQQRETFEHERRYQPRIVVDDEELGVVDVYYLMCVVVICKKSNYILLIIGAHPQRRVECVAKSLSGPGEVLDPEFWVQQRSVKLAKC